MVVLGAELEVAHDDRDLGARDDQDHKHEKEEAEDVVPAMSAATVSTLAVLTVTAKGKGAQKASMQAMAIAVERCAERTQ